MKKIFKLIIVLLIIFIFFELIIFVFKTNHEVEYTIKNNNQTYKINETYKNHKYYFKITNKNEIYSFETDNDFHKRKRVIKGLYLYDGNDLKCIYPILKKDNNKSNIICTENRKSYSYEYYKNELKIFVSELKEEGYYSPSWKEESKKQRKIDAVSVYPNSIGEDTYIYIYKYNGFYRITNDSISKVRLFKNDTYKNTLGVQVNKFYVIPNYNEKHDYSTFYRIDMTTNKKKEIKLKNKISKDSYVNGVLDNKIYIFDKDSLKQYQINPKKKKVKEVGNKEKGIIYYNLKEKRINVYEARDKQKTFKTIGNYIKQLEKNTTLKHIVKDKDTYYYQIKNNNLYYYNSNSKTKVLILNKPISDLKLVNDTLYFISDSNLYSYSFTEGLKKLVTYNELSFNPKNRIAIYME